MDWIWHYLATEMPPWAHTDVKEKNCIVLSQNTPASNNLSYTVPPLWYQQSDERMSHKLSLSKLLAADAVNELCAHPHTFVLVGEGGGKFKHKALMWLICRMFSF